MGDILQLRNLRKVYPGGVVAVDDLSLNVSPGEFVTFLGPSGCGKTTTLRMIAGFESPDEGKVVLDGDDITQVPPFRRPVNTVFQDYALFPHLTIIENVGYGLKRQGLTKQETRTRAGEALEKVELSNKASQRPHMLSGGQRQRVALARALVCNPKVLLLDEPLSALDAKLRGAMQVELKHLHETIGLTFILVTHDQTEAMVLSDKVVIMEFGKIVQIGQPSDLYDHPTNAYVADFIGTSNILLGAVSRIDGDNVIVATDVGDITAPLDGRSYRNGQSVSLCMRPEKMSILEPSANPQPGSSIVKAKVDDHFYHGSYVRFSLKTHQGQELTVDSPLESNMKNFSVPDAGALVDVAIRNDSIVILD